jgi:glycosyltransferase involved in cell wall biosynthesis
MSDELEPGDPFPKTERIDLVVCTWNRATQLERMLDSVFRLIVPYDRMLRLIIVNNNSTDRTDELLNRIAGHKFFDRHRLLVLDEPKQGHTRARNKAIDHLASDLVMWTDDDVLVDANWVSSTVADADANSSVAFFGGKILANLQPKMPTWIAENWELLKGCFAERDLGDHRLPLDEGRLPYGANFAVRTSVQKQFRFDASLGRRGEKVLGEDEIDLFRRLIDDGWEGRWNPDSVVDHVIDAERINEEYIRRYFVGQGRALVKRGEPWHTDEKRLWWASLLHYINFRFKRQFAPSPAWLAQLIRSGLAEGQYAQLKEADI